MNNINGMSNILRLKIKSKDYNSAIDILKKEIINEYTIKIQKIDRNFEYSNILNLMNKANKILSKEQNIELKKYFIITNDECGAEYELHKLIDIYSRLMKGGINNDF